MLGASLGEMLGASLGAMLRERPVAGDASG